MTNIDNFNKQPEVIDSREVSKYTGERHAETLRKIKTMISYISENAKLRSQDYFIESSYKAKGNNKTYLCYLLTKLGCEMYVNKLSGVKGTLFTAFYVKRFDEMEHQLSEPQIAEPNYGEFADAIPTNMSEALRLAADLKEEADYYKPRAQRFDLYMSSRFYWTITQIAENYGMTAWQLNDLLAQLHIQYKRGERWYLYAPYKNLGYKVQRPGVSKTGKRYTSTYWTEAGRMFINDQLEKLNLRDTNVRNYMGDKKIIPLNQQRSLFQ